VFSEENKLKLEISEMYQHQPKVNTKI